MPFKQLNGWIKDGECFVDENEKIRQYKLSIIVYGTPQVGEPIIYEEDDEG